MALATLSDVLTIAEKEKNAVPAFNVDNIEIPQILLKVAEEEKSPLIFAVGQGAINNGKLSLLAESVIAMAAEATIPVVLHLDHGKDFEQIISCLRAGFSSVMIDGSHLPLLENIELTKLVVRAAHSVGVSVEAEIGAIMGAEDGIMCTQQNLARVEDVERFISAVEVDALAVGIGNAHGLYIGEPKLNFDLLRSIKKLSPPPLVLHGGSGISDNMICEAIDAGIRKINVATEIRMAFLAGLRGTEERDIYKTYSQGQARVAEVARQKIRVFQKKEGCSV